MAPLKKLAFAAFTVGLSEAFSPASNHPGLTQCNARWKHRRSEGVSLNAFAGLARKMKEKELAGLKENAEEYLALRGKNKASDQIATLLNKRSGTLATVVEYRRKGTGIASMADQNLPPYIISRDFRIGGADVISVLLDKSGGCTVEDCEVIVKEQNGAKGDFPGPMPIIWNDLVIDEVQLGLAAKSGAQGVVLQAGVLADGLADMANAAREYGLEVVVEVRSGAELDALLAKDLAPEVVSVVLLSKMSADDAIALMPKMPDAAVKAVLVPAYDDLSLIEAEDAWRLRDAGCNAIWASEVLFKFGYNDGEHCMSVIKAIKSKGSVKYARASGAYVGRGEGAKEYLGDLMI